MYVTNSGYGSVYNVNNKGTTYSFRGTRQAIGPATRCDAVNPRWDVPMHLRCRKIACDALRWRFQHVGNFAPDFGITQLYIVRFSNRFQQNDGHLIYFHVICNRNFSVIYF